MPWTVKTGNKRMSSMNEDSDLSDDDDRELGSDESSEEITASQLLPMGIKDIQELTMNRDQDSEFGGGNNNNNDSNDNMVNSNDNDYSNDDSIVNDNNDDSNDNDYNNDN